MSRFYGSMKGARGETTRCGNSISGITAHVRGWDIGAEAYVRCLTTGEDIVSVYVTGGSNGSCAKLFLGTFIRTDTGFRKVGDDE